MSTKTDPGPFDCYAKLAPDEPYFVLRAKDPTAIALVILWAGINGRSGETINTAMTMLNDCMVRDNIMNPQEETKIFEAVKTSNSMLKWHMANRADVANQPVKEDDNASPSDPKNGDNPTS